MNYTIRKAEPADAAGTAKVHTETWQKHYRGQIPDEYLNNLSIEKRTESWTEIFSNLKVGESNFIAEEEGNIIGFCSVGPSRDADSPTGTGELYSIYLETSSHGRGIGTALMNTGLDFLKEQGFKKVVLWVLKTNIKTIKFYESKGWKFDGGKKIDKNDARTFEELRYSLDL
jgi:ribosomal protein S18 acetylase RimI-like enzyme